MSGSIWQKYERIPDFAPNNVPDFPSEGDGTDYNAGNQFEPPVQPNNNANDKNTKI